MAVDTANKRYSMLGIGLDFGRVRSIPDNDIGTSDRLHLMPLYDGIAAGAPTAGGTTNRRMHAMHATWRHWKLIFRQGE